VKRIVMEQFARAREILEANREQVETVTAALLERETIDGEEFQMLMRGEELPEPEIKLDHSVGDDDADDTSATGSEPEAAAVDPAKATEAEEPQDTGEAPGTEEPQDTAEAPGTEEPQDTAEAPETGDADVEGEEPEERTKPDDRDRP
jgi:cell division protease FtsH